jgi:hypothetical protein
MGRRREINCGRHGQSRAAASEAAASREQQEQQQQQQQATAMKIRQQSSK